MDESIKTDSQVMDVDDTKIEQHSSQKSQSRSNSSKPIKRAAITELKPHIQHGQSVISNENKIDVEVIRENTRPSTAVTNGTRYSSSNYRKKRKTNLM